MVFIFSHFKFQNSDIFVCLLSIEFRAFHVNTVPANLISELHLEIVLNICCKLDLIFVYSPFKKTAYFNNGTEKELICLLSRSQTLMMRMLNL